MSFENISLTWDIGGVIAPEIKHQRFLSDPRRPHPYYGTIFLVNFLNKIGFHQYALTARPYNYESSTRNWLEKHVPILSPYLLIRNNSDISGIQFKIERIKEINPLIHFESSDYTVRCINASIGNSVAIPVHNPNISFPYLFYRIARRAL